MKEYYCPYCQKSVKPEIGIGPGQKQYEKCPDCQRQVAHQPSPDPTVTTTPIGFGQTPRAQNRRTRGWG